jgi:DNA-binding transcriptional regulator YdaS (Cro superfamily)
MNKEALIRKIRNRINRCGSQVSAAKSMDISPQYLNDILTGKRMPAGKILRALGVERVTTYREFEK